MAETCIDVNDADVLMARGQEIVVGAAESALVVFALFACIAALANTQETRPRRWFWFFYNILLVTPLTVVVVAIALTTLVPPDVVIRRAAIFAFVSIWSDTNPPLVASVARVVVSLIATMIIEEALCIAVAVVGSDENKKTDNDGFQGRKTSLFIVKGLLPIVLPLLVGPLRMPEVVVVLILSILKPHPDTGA